MPFHVSPSKAAAPFCSPDPGLCGVCARAAVWLGYAPITSSKALRGPVMWLCTEEACHRRAAEVYHGGKAALRAFKAAEEKYRASVRTHRAPPR